MTGKTELQFGHLTHLLLGNFKAFKQTQRIPIRPVTLIYGKNNSGKSNIIQALLYAEHARRTSELNPAVIEKAGQRVLHGGLDRVVHGHSNPGKVTFGWEWENPSTDGPYKLGKFLQDLYSNPEVDEVGLNSEYTLNGESFLSVSGLNAFCPGPNLEHPNYLAALRSIQHLLAKEFRAWIKSRKPNAALRKILPRVVERLERGMHYRTAIEDGLFDTLYGFRMGRHGLPPEFSYVSQMEFERDSYEVAASWGLGESLEANIAAFIAERAGLMLFGWLNYVRDQFTEPLDSLVNSMHYLGAYRSRPETVFFRDPKDVFEDIPKRNDPVGGDLDPLEFLNIGGRHGATLTAQHRDWIWQPESVEKANRWLQKNRHLTGNIELRCDNVSGKTGRKRTGRLTSKAGVPVSLTLYDRDRKVSLSFREAGYGLSQFIPVLLACFAHQHYIPKSGGTTIERIGRTPAGTLLLEEPEAHVHPALQSEVGEIFIDAVTRESSPLGHVICETHSEHLLLRVMRRMREGRIKPSQVAVLYVENLGRESIVREMPLNERGELLRDWPGGFFEEGLREVLI